MATRYLSETLHSNEICLHFQFLLSDFFKAYLLLEKWESQEEMRNTLSSLFNAFNPTKDELPWNPKTALLHSLEGYTSQLASSSKNPLYKKLHECFCLANSSGFELLSIMKNLKKNKASELIVHRMKVHKLMKKASKLIFNLLADFKDDENVILFLVNHTVEFENVYGKGTFKKWMEDLYSEGLSQVRQFLLIRYAQRGFDHLLPLIEDKFALLRSDTL